MSNTQTRHAKILATIGPASRNEDTLTKIVEAGANAFRLNFSHGTHEDHQKTVDLVRSIEQKTGKPLAILQDLQGPKIRIGEMQDAFDLKAGSEFVLDYDLDTPGDATRAPMPHENILKALDVGNHVFINDGIVKLKVKSKDGMKITCEVLAGGKVSTKKGVNLPDLDLPISALTEKDRADATFAAKAGVDWVALSFVQRAEDVEELRELIGANTAKIMAKIEKPNAVERIDEIIEASDGIMIARGDLGVEMPLEEVPSIQKKIIRKCRDAGKPVVVATQMLESMIVNASPTRAEVSDVANATFEGADAVMLSAETAAGSYPVEAVEMMSKTVSRVERSSAWRPLIEAIDTVVEETVDDAITLSAFYTADVANVRAIVSFTETGNTAIKMSRHRPDKPILALTPHIKTARSLGLVWGVEARICEEPKSTAHLVELATKEGLKGCGDEGKYVVITAGVPFGVSGSTNMLRVAEI